VKSGSFSLGILALILTLLSCGGREVIEVTLEADTAGYSDSELASAKEQTATIILERLRLLGARRSKVDWVGPNRLLVKIVGTEDSLRALSLIGKVGRLDFRLLGEYNDFYNTFDCIDKELAGLSPDKEFDSSDLRPFSSLLEAVDNDVAVKSADLKNVEDMLCKAQKAIPAGYEVFFGPGEQIDEADEAGEGGDEYYIKRIYLVEKEIQMTGQMISRAKANPYTGNQASLAGTWVVNIELTDEGQLRLSKISGDNIGRRLAIVFDEEVVSAPVIKERIPPGSDAVITTHDYLGHDTRDMAMIINTGCPTLSLRIVEVKPVE
jgi:SecD/SecF fusion protein